MISSLWPRTRKEINHSTCCDDALRLCDEYHNRKLFKITNFSFPSLCRSSPSSRRQHSNFPSSRRLMILCEMRELLFPERTQKSSQQQHGKCKKGRATHVMGAESPSSVRRRGLRLMLIWRMGINFLFLPRLFSCAACDSLPLDPCWERKFTSYTHSSVVSLWMIMFVRWMNRMWREKALRMRMQWRN